MTSVEAKLRDLGAKDNKGEWKRMYPLRLETKAGDLIIDVLETWVAMRFIDIPRASKFFSHREVNPYTGKFNIHFHKENISQVERCLELIEGKIRPVLL